jgi:hypothetical protein
MKVGGLLSNTTTMASKSYVFPGNRGKHFAELETIMGQLTLTDLRKAAKGTWLVKGYSKMTRDEVTLALTEIGGFNHTDFALIYLQKLKLAELYGLATQNGLEDLDPKFFPRPGVEYLLSLPSIVRQREKKRFIIELKRDLDALVV